MRHAIDRRTFLKAGTTTAVALLGGALRPSRSAAQSDKLVVAVGQWGLETPFAWRSSQSEKTLWECVYDSLITRDPKTFAMRPGLATEWKPSNELRTWTFKLRQGVQFHEGLGEMTAEDVKFTIEQNLRPDSPGGSAPFFRINLDRIEIPDKYTIVLHFKNRLWEVPAQVSQFVGYQNITSKKYLETVGEEKAAQHPIGTGPYRHVEGRQGDFHRFEALPKHWRQTPAFKELVVRRVPDAATRLSGLRTGEIDIGQVLGDYLDQAQRSGLKIHETKEAVLHWVVLSGQTAPDKEDFCPTCPWVGDYNDKKSQENARKVRLALNLAVDKKAIINGLWRGRGTETPFSYFYNPFHKGYSKDWKVPPHDPAQARKLLAEAGQGGGFEVRVNPMVFTYALDGNDMMEAVALDWEKVGIKVRRVPENFANFLPKNRTRKTGKTHWVYGAPPFDEPGLAWQRCTHTKGAFALLNEGLYEKEIDAAVAEVDTDKRGKLTHDMGQKLYENYHGVMLGMKNVTWAMTKKVGTWQTLVYVPLENNYEYVSKSDV